VSSSGDDIVQVTLHAMRATAADIDRLLESDNPGRNQVRELMGGMRNLLDQVVDAVGGAAAAPCFELFEETRSKVASMFGTSAWDSRTPEEATRPRRKGLGPRPAGEPHAVTDISARCAACGGGYSVRMLLAERNSQPTDVEVTCPHCSQPGVVRTSGRPVSHPVVTVR
jgi:hypothetical protein